MTSTASTYRHRAVLVVLAAAASLAMVGAIVGGRILANNLVLDGALALGIAAGLLIAVITAQEERAEPPAPPSPPSPPEMSENSTLSETAETAEVRADDESPVTVASDEVAPIAHEIVAALPKVRNFIPSLIELQRRMDRWRQVDGNSGVVRVAIGVVGGAIGLRQFFRLSYVLTPPTIAAVIVSLSALVVTGLMAMSARYFADVDAAILPEARGLARGSRVLAWLSVVVAGGIALQWLGQFAVLRAIHLLVAIAIVSVCAELTWAPKAQQPASPELFLDLKMLAALGARPNILASVLDAIQNQLGIDLRSTWALTVVRRGIEPLVAGLLIAGWLSTSLTVVGLDEVGLVERLGVPVGTAPLESGLHIHLPWPIDHVYRLPIRRVQAIQIGHEGQEAPGPENVIWTVEHAPNEFTLMLGDGRDLITVDAAVQYRIEDARAWRYHSVDPELALKALAYRAVMRNTVNRTLSDALSENVEVLASRIRTMVQQEADTLDLGVRIVGFTIGGMHPPVPVAASYESVVSAQIGKVTAVVNAQAFRNRALPAAEDTALMQASTAHADGAGDLARAAGDAWAFRTLESQYHASPADYVFRRRLETLESALAGRPFTVVDARFLRDGGELWMTP